MPCGVCLASVVSCTIILRRKFSHHSSSAVLGIILLFATYSTVWGDYFFLILFIFLFFHFLVLYVENNIHCAWLYLQALHPYQTTCLCLVFTQLLKSFIFLQSMGMQKTEKSCSNSECTLGMCSTLHPEWWCNG